MKSLPRRVRKRKRDVCLHSSHQSHVVRRRPASRWSAIAAATVGIGVHGGAEASLATADVAMTRDGLAALVALDTGARRAMRVIRRNIAWAFAYNSLGVVLAVTGHITPLVAAIMMPASSLTVVLCSWLGKTFTPEPQ